MRAKFEFNGKIKEIILSNINVFYGYNNVGKTYLSKIFNDGFIQKNKTLFMINGYQPSKNDFEVLYINSSHTMEDHIKFSAKSFLRKIYLDKIINHINSENKFEDFIIEKFINTNKYLETITESLNKNLEHTLKINLNLDMIEDIIINNILIEYSNDNICDSSKKTLLFKTICEFINSSPINKIIIIDDFDLYLDEKNIKFTLDLFSAYPNHTFILFSSNSASIPYVFNKFNFFCIRDNNIINLTEVKSMIKYSFLNEENDFTFEEYYIENSLLILDEEYEIIEEKIKSNLAINLGRMLTNKFYSFNINDDIFVKIIPTSKIEKNFLLYIHNIIKE